MDGIPAVEPELDGFSLTLPLPYRVALMIVLATWGWGTNLHYLYLQKIDVPALIRYPGRASPTQVPHHHSVYRLAAATSVCLGSSLFFFWALTRRDPARVLAYDWLPMTTLAVLALLLVLPLPCFLPVPALPRAINGGGGGGGGGGSGTPPLWALPQDGRRRFAATLRRVAVGGLAEAAHGKFGDILLADVLTSYAKVLGDLYVCVCMFFFTSRAGREASATDRPDRNCGGAVIVPLILAAPSLARFRQCLIEYRRVRRAVARYDGGGGAGGGGNGSDDGLGWGGQHLANAAKYASAFPVIAFAALQRRGGDNAADAAAAAYYHQAWILAVLFNSLYSFYWDVAKDWDLTLFEAARQEARNSHSGSAIRSEYPWGLRRRLHLRPAPLVYYAAIAVDLMLRLSWVLTLRGSSPADGGSVERTLFLVEVLEVVRRWLWIFFRVETEWVRGGSGGGGGGGMGLGLGVGSSSGLNPTDILLGDYQGKYDDEDD